MSMSGFVEATDPPNRNLNGGKPRQKNGIRTVPGGGSLGSVLNTLKAGEPWPSA